MRRFGHELAIIVIGQLVDNLDNGRLYLFNSRTINRCPRDVVLSDLLRGRSRPLQPERTFEGLARIGLDDPKVTELWEGVKNHPAIMCNGRA